MLKILINQMSEFCDKIPLTVYMMPRATSKIQTNYWVKFEMFGFTSESLRKYIQLTARLRDEFLILHKTKAVHAICVTQTTLLLQITELPTVKTRHSLSIKHAIVHLCHCQSCRELW